jgi:hypothetical protein
MNYPATDQEKRELEYWSLIDGLAQGPDCYELREIALDMLAFAERWILEQRRRKPR